jgi:hypothetical protein
MARWGPGAAAPILAAGDVRVDGDDHENVTHTSAQEGCSWFGMIRPIACLHVASAAEATNHLSEVTAHICRPLGPAVKASRRHSLNCREGSRLRATNPVRSSWQLSVVHAPTQTASAFSSSRTPNAQPARLRCPLGTSASPTGPGACAISVDATRISCPWAPAGSHPASNASASSTREVLTVPPKHPRASRARLRDCLTDIRNGFLLLPVLRRLAQYTNRLLVTRKACSRLLRASSSFEPDPGDVPGGGSAVSWPCGVGLAGRF